MTVYFLKKDTSCLVFGLFCGRIFGPIKRGFVFVEVIE